MNLKKLFLVAALLAAAAVAVLWQSRQAQVPGRLGGIAPAEGLDLGGVHRIEIHWSSGKTELERQADESWAVASIGGYPADAGKIRGLLLSLVDLRLGEELTRKSEHHDRFQVRDPEDADAPEQARGTKVVLLDAGSQSLLELLLGKERAVAMASDAQFSPRDGGQYVRVGGGARVSLIKRRIRVDRDAEKWLLKELLDVKRADVARVELQRAGDEAPVVIKREEREADLVLEGVKESEKAKTSELNNVAGALERFILRSVALDPPEFSETDHYRLSTFEGLNYSVELGGEVPGQSHQVYARVSVEAEGEEAGQKASELQKRFDRWTFIIDKYRADRLRKTRADLVEEAEEQETPAETEPEGNLESSPEESGEPGGDPGGSGEEESPE